MRGRARFVYEDFWLSSYSPPSLPSAVVLVLVVASSLAAVVHGVSLSFYTPRGSASLLVLQALAPLQFWGLALLAGGWSLLVALIFRVHSAVWVSHIYLTALNVCLTISLAQSVYYFGGGAGEALLPASSAVWHGFLIYLTNPFKTGARRG